MSQPHPDMDNRDVRNIAEQIAKDQDSYVIASVSEAQHLLEKCGWFDEPAWSEWINARMAGLSKRLNDKFNKE